MIDDAWKQEAKTKQPELCPHLPCYAVRSKIDGSYAGWCVGLDLERKTLDYVSLCRFEEQGLGNIQCARTVQTPDDVCQAIGLLGEALREAMLTSLEYLAARSISKEEIEDYESCESGTA